MSNIPSSFLLKNKRFASLIGCINSIEDPRTRHFKHPFESIIIIALCTMLAGSNDFTAIEQFGKDYRDWFYKFLYLPYDMPSHDTFNRMFSLIQPEEMRKLLYWLNQTMQKDKFFLKKDNPVIIELLDQICIDGKMLKSFQSGNKYIIEHAWSVKGGAIINQLRVLVDEGEITTVPKLLAKLDIKNKVITMDAISTQKKIIKQIVQMGGFYVSALKGNQHNFYKDVKDFMNSIRKGEFKDVPEIKTSFHETTDTGHGRTETRKIWITTSLGWLEQRKEWQGLKTIMVVESTVEEKRKTYSDCRYFISNLQLDAESFLMIVRNHWAIESKCHWLLNTAFSEKRSNLRKGYAPENMSVLRKICLTLLREESLKLSVKNKRAKAAHDFKYLLKILLGKDIDIRSNAQKAYDATVDSAYSILDFAITAFA